jgi:hypothetical protein
VRHHAMQLGGILVYSCNAILSHIFFTNKLLPWAHLNIPESFGSVVKNATYRWVRPNSLWAMSPRSSGEVSDSALLKHKEEMAGKQFFHFTLLQNIYHKYILHKQFPHLKLGIQRH